MRDQRDVMSKHHGKVAFIVKILLWFYAACTMFVLVYMTYQSLRPRRGCLEQDLWCSGDIEPGQLY